ncbi:hypothetical protein [Sphingobacterium sp. 1.A.5]|uniref:hypothetical protein n=1 Tax=Sphingobacterium sp. 1.A.5 TaxID=2044604 RepID=UPI000C0BD2C2|nr:hypothetical protein [Sphingobacterium sp. 1.A.5]
MSPQEFIIKYWSQISVMMTIFFGGIWNVSKLFLDWKINQEEIKYSTIFTKRTVSLEDYIFNTMQFDRFFKNLPYYDIGSQKISPKEVDELVEKYQVPFLRSSSSFKIFAKKSDRSIINRLDEVFLDNKKQLSKLLFSNLSQNEVYHPDDYYSTIIENGKEINNLLERLILSAELNKNQ